MTLLSFCSWHLKCYCIRFFMFKKRNIQFQWILRGSAGSGVQIAVLHWSRFQNLAARHHTATLNDFCSQILLYVASIGLSHQSHLFHLNMQGREPHLLTDCMDLCGLLCFSHFVPVPPSMFFDHTFFHQHMPGDIRTMKKFELPHGQPHEFAHLHCRSL